MKLLLWIGLATAIFTTAQAQVVPATAKVTGSRGNFDVVGVPFPDKNKQPQGNADLYSKRGADGKNSVAANGRRANGQTFRGLGGQEGERAKFISDAAGQPGAVNGNMLGRGGTLSGSAKNNDNEFATQNRNRLAPNGDDQSDFGFRNPSRGQGRRMNAQRARACRGGTNNCKFRAQETGGQNAGGGTLVPTNSQDGGSEDGYFLYGKDEQGEPLFYRTECEKSSGSRCATLKSSIVNKQGSLLMNCSTDPPQNRNDPPKTCCKRGNSGSNCDVEAVTDRDGQTIVKYRGVEVQNSQCEAVGRGDDGKYYCAAGKGIFKVSNEKRQGTSSSQCYQPSGPNDRVIEVVEDTIEFVRDNPSKTDFAFPECGTMKGDLIFKGGWQQSEMTNIMANLGLQVSASITPAGKLQCQDVGVCPVSAVPNPAETDCFYCNFCDEDRKGKNFYSSAELPCNVTPRVGSRMPFKAKVCPPTEQETAICPSMGSSLTNGYLNKKGDMDVKLEVWWRDNSKTKSQWRTEFDNAWNGGIIGKTIAQITPIEFLARSTGGATDADSIFALWWAQKQNRGTLVGCSTFVADYGAAKSGADALQGAKAAESILKGDYGGFIGGRRTKC